MGSTSSNTSNTEIQNIVENNIINKSSFDASFQSTIKNNSKCKSTTSQKMEIKFGEIGGDFNLTNSKMTQKADVSLDCVQESSVQLELINNLIKDSVNNFKNSSENDIGKVMESAAKAQSLSTSNSTSSNNSSTKVFNDSKTNVQNIISNSIKNNINLENSKECINSINQEAKISAAKVKGYVNINKLEMTQQVETFAKCMNIDSMITNTQNDIKEKFGVSQEIENKNKISESQKSKSESTGVIGDIGNVITNIFSGLSGLLTAAYVPFIIGGVIVFAYLYYSDKADGSENMNNNMGSIANNMANTMNNMGNNMNNMGNNMNNTMNNNMGNTMNNMINNMGNNN